jgi:outer membrane protein
MKLASSLLTALVLLAPIQAKSKVAILNVQKAILSTEDGKAASAELNRKSVPVQERLKQQEAELAKQRNQPGVETLEKTHRRDMEDARHQLELERDRVLKDLTAKLTVVVEKYARKRHFEVVLDENAPSIFWRASGTDITDEVIKLYNQTKSH